MTTHKGTYLHKNKDIIQSILKFGVCAGFVCTYSKTKSGLYKVSIK